MSFAKLDSGIVNSTLWVQPDDVLRVWIWFLSQADAQGVVRTAAPALALICMKPVDRVREILALLEAPDPDSRSEVEEGRRIRKVPGGWQLINYAAYRAERDPDADRERKREWDRQHRPSGHARAKQSDDSPTVRQQSDDSPPGPTQAEAEVDVEAKDQKLSGRQADRREAEGRFPEWWAAYPKPVKRKAALAIWQRRKLDAMADRLIADVRNRVANDDGWQRGYAPDPTTYLNQDRWNDALRTAPRARAGPSAQPSKTRALIERLEGMKHGLADPRTDDRPAEVALLGAGSHPGN